MRRTSFAAFASIMFVTAIGPVRADDVPAYLRGTADIWKHGTPIAPWPKPPPSWQPPVSVPCVVGLAQRGKVRPAHFSACHPDDRRCEVVSKMGHCVVDDTRLPKR